MTSLYSLLSITIAILVDQALKLAAGWYDITVYNQQGPFSIPIANEIIILTSSIILLALAWFLYYITYTNLTGWGILLIIAGGLSNLLDRLVRGYTIDMIVLGSAQFNMADFMIWVGAVVTIGSLLASDVKRGKVN